VSQTLAPAEHASLQTAPVSHATVPAQGLLWHAQKHSRLSVTRLVHKEGGTISFPSIGMQLVVPRGALTADMTITITALPGKVVAYEFEPHGAVFLVPLTFIQDLDQTDFDGIKLPPGFTPHWDGAYFSSSSAIDETTGLSVVQETIPANAAWSWRGANKSGRCSFPISHFSGYMISTGRSDEF
jgi:hypothetical protein